MKSAIIITFLIFLITSCGNSKQEVITTFDDGDLQERLRDHEERLKRLETLVMRLDDLDTMEADLGVLEANLELLESTQITTMEELQGIVDAFDAFESQFGVGTIVDIVNPCGDNSGHDEILFKTINGGLVAYFESGNKRYLSELDVGNYVTTDGTGCQFNVVDNNGTLGVQ